MTRKSAIALALATASSAHAQFGANLVANPSFEDYTPDAAGLMQVQLPGGDYIAAIPDAWTITDGMLYADRYDSGFGPANGAPAGSGDRHVYGGFEALSRCEQTIDLGFIHSAAAGVSAPGLRYELSAYLGSFFGGNFPDTQDDIATIELRFYAFGSSDRPLQVDQLVGPRIPSDVGYPDGGIFNANNFSGLVSREGVVPAGADHAVMIIHLVRDADAISTAFNNANADLIQFVVRAPCPGDINGDGEVNFADLNAVLAAFNTTCP